MEDFYTLFLRYLKEKNEDASIDWNKIESPSDKEVIPYSSLSSVDKETAKGLLNKLAVLKLNGKSLDQ